MMTLGWWSPVRVVDGSRKARRNAERALGAVAGQREAERVAVARFEREHTASPRGEELEQIRRTVGLG